VTSGLAIYDTMQYIRPRFPRCVWDKGQHAALLLAAGEKGKRFALPHSRILIHQPMEFSRTGVGCGHPGKRNPPASEELNRLWSGTLLNLWNESRRIQIEILYERPSGEGIRIVDEVVSSVPSVSRLGPEGDRRREDEGERRELRDRLTLFFLRKESG